jgi:hypothetical protein
MIEKVCATDKKKKDKYLIALRAASQRTVRAAMRKTAEDK